MRLAGPKSPVCYFAHTCAVDCELPCCTGNDHCIHQNYNWAELLPPASGMRLPCLQWLPAAPGQAAAGEGQSTRDNTASHDLRSSAHFDPPRHPQALAATAGTLQVQYPYSKGLSPM